MANEVNVTKRGGIGEMLWALAAKREYGLSLVVAIILIVVSVRSPEFLRLGNVRDLLVYCTQPAIVACGVMLVIVTGEIDISVGSMLGLLTAVMGTLVSSKTAPLPGFGWPVWAAVLATVALGTGLGLLNGVMVTLVRVPSIIVTLAMLMILNSLTIKIMHRGNITDLPAGLRWFGIGEVLGIRASIWIMGLVLLGTWGMIRYTPIGRRIYAVGSNPHAAALAGLSVTRVKIFVFALTGFLVGVTTLVTTLGAYDNGIGTGFELLVVTCVVVGGVSISGGVGPGAGIFLGVVLLSIQKPVLIFMTLGPGWSNWDKAIQGLLILVAVLVDHFAGQRKKRGALMEDQTRLATDEGKAIGGGEGISYQAPAMTLGSPGFAQRVGAFGHELLLLVVLVVLLVVARGADARFMMTGTQQALIFNVWDLALLALPMTLVIITGGIDLSVASTMALSAVVMGMLFQLGPWPMWAAALAAVATGTACGALNGWFVSKIKVHPLIVTLATYSAYRGLAEGLSLGFASLYKTTSVYSGFPEWFTNLGLRAYPASADLRHPHWYSLSAAGWLFVAGRYCDGGGAGEDAVWADAVCDRAQRDGGEVFGVEGGAGEDGDLRIVRVGGGGGVVEQRGAIQHGAGEHGAGAGIGCDHGGGAGGDELLWRARADHRDGAGGGINS